MDSHPQAKPPSDRRANSASDRRTDDRIPLVELTCDRGELVDLSPSGARLETRWPWREGKTRSITIFAGAEQMTFRARCIWSMREGLFRHTIGLYFEDVTTEQFATLTELSRQHGVRTLGLGYSDAA